MRLGQSEEATVQGLPWPSVVVVHQSMDVLANAGADATSVVRDFAVSVAPRHGGPATPDALAEWVEYHPALAQALVARVLETQQPTVRERLFLRVTAFHRPGDGVWELEGNDAELGLSPAKPMPRAYATRWDTAGAVEIGTEEGGYADPLIEHRDDGRGIGCHVHPRLAMVVCPRLRSVISYHAMAGPEARLTRHEYLTMSAFEVFCHRVLRDAAARRGNQ